MPIEPAPAPRLASDILRSWIAVGTAVVIGVVTWVIILAVGDELAGNVGVSVSLYVGWIALAFVMTALTFAVFGRAGSADLRTWLVETGPPSGRGARIAWSINGGGVIWWAITGAAVTMYTLVELAVGPTRPPLTVVLIGAAVIVASAGLIILSFAVHYARLDAEGGGFTFSGDAPPTFLDYCYLSAQVSTTFGGSDVGISSTRTRNAVALHGIIAAAFNTVLVALFLSVLLSAAQSG